MSTLFLRTIHNSIIKTLQTKQKGFINFVGEKSKIIHEDSIHHFRAGKGGVFNNYCAWQTERI
jgi:ABC-type polar amino acid transport system ATPase subunit